MKHVLFLLKSPPYGTLRAAEGYRAAAGLVAMGIKTSLVLLGDGVYAAVRGQDSSRIGQNCFETLIAELGEMGVTVHAHGSSLEERGLTPDMVHPHPGLSPAALSAMIRQADAVMVF